MTWTPRPWKLAWRRLTIGECALLDETLAKIARVLGLRQCACGLPADAGMAHGERCRGCWDKER